MTKAPDPSVLPEVRDRVLEAQRSLRDACLMLTDGNWPDNGAALSAEIGRLDVWTQPGGFLDHLERAKT